MLVRSSDAAVAEGAEWAWINRYVKGAFRTVLSLRGVLLLFRRHCVRRNQRLELPYPVAATQI